MDYQKKSELSDGININHQIDRWRPYANCLLAAVLICSPVVHSEDCARNVQPIEKGQAAQCDGYLFSPGAEETAAKAVETAKLREQENDILNRRLELYIKQSDVLATEVSRRRVTDDLYRGLYFVAGAIVAGYIAVNANR